MSRYQVFALGIGVGFMLCSFVIGVWACLKGRK